MLAHRPRLPESPAPERRTPDPTRVRAGLGLRPLTGALCLVLAPLSGHADCRLELELIGSDLHGVVLTERQKQALAPLVDDALKLCRIGREAAALEAIEKARHVAGIRRSLDDLDTDFAAHE
ncbi:MAG: hypothetical protein GC151_17275 [Betaproteobacteria bacterium]|nr:hypothetical protein [Betaproteobacteria bacterium]